MKREFDEIMDSLKTTIASYDYFVDYKKVFEHVLKVNGPVDKLNTLIGRKEDFDEAFIKMIHQYPETLQVIPILLAYRTTNYKMNVIDGKMITYDFKRIINTDEQYLKFFKETGLKELFVGGHITNIRDYLIGVEVGLDSNARKNRSGSTMESIVEDYLSSYNDKITFLCQAEKTEIVQRFGYPELLQLNLSEGNSQAEKRFDFAFKYEDVVFLVETNFYGSGGSKLNEVSRSYEKLADEINKLKHYKFVWVTDGIGWKSARNNLHESYSHQKIMLTLADFETNNLINMIQDCLPTEH